MSFMICVRMMKYLSCFIYNSNIAIIIKKERKKALPRVTSCRLLAGSWLCTHTHTGCKEGAACGILLASCITLAGCTIRS